MSDNDFPHTDSTIREDFYFMLAIFLGPNIMK